MVVMNDEERWAAVMRREGRWRVLLLGADDGGVLQAVVRRAVGAAGECRVSSDVRGGGARGVPAVQALQAEYGGAGGGACRGGGAGVPRNRSGGEHSWARGAGVSG